MMRLRPDPKDAFFFVGLVLTGIGLAWRFDAGLALIVVGGVLTAVGVVATMWRRRP